jgi:hypothetical protein
VIAQDLQLLQEDPCALVKRAPGLAERDPIPAAVEQVEPQLRLQVLDGCRDRRLRPAQLLGGGLKAALADDRIEAEQLVDRDPLDHLNILWSWSIFNSFNLWHAR